MNTDACLICLGAGSNQIPLIQAGSKLGYKVIAIDRNESAPGFTDAHSKITHDITDHKGIVNKIEQLGLSTRIHGVVTRSFGQVVQSAAMLADHYGTPGPGKNTPALFLKKRSFKENLHEQGIFVPPIFSWHNQSQKEILLESEEPLIVRPSIGHAKQGLSILKSRQEREDFLQKNPMDDGSILVEAIMPGNEITVMGLVQAGKYQSIMISDKITSTKPPLYIELEHKFPSHISTKIQTQVTTVMQRICDITHLENTPVVAEFLIVPDDAGTPKICLVEVTPETGGEYLAEILLPTIYPDLNYFEMLVRLACKKNMQVDKSIQESQLKIQNCAQLCFIGQQEGQLISLTIPDELVNHPDLIFLKQLKQLESHTFLTGGNSDRLFVFGIKQKIENQSELSEMIQKFKNKIKVSYATK